MQNAGIRTITQLPPGYREVRFLRVTEGLRLVWLNVAAGGVLLVAGVVFFGWLYFYHTLLSAPLVIGEAPDSLPRAAAILLVLLVIPVHEWFHGLGIRYYGHAMRYGIKWRKGVVYATTDNGLFWRDQFIVVALAPLGAISVIAVAFSVFVPAGVGVWLVIIATLNATGAIGELWMVRAASRYPPDALIRDEEDGMRVFCR